MNSYLECIARGLLQRGHDLAFVHQNPVSQGCRSELRSLPRRVCLEETGLENGLRTLAEFQPNLCFSHNMRFLEVEEALVGRWPTLKFMHIFLGTCVSGTKSHRLPSQAPCDRAFGLGCVGAYFPRRCGSFSPTALVRGYRWASRQRALFPRYAGVAVGSGYMEREFLANGVAPGRLHRIPLFAASSASESKPTAAARFERPGGVSRLVFIGRMTSLKGATLAVQAVASAQERLGRPLELVFIGDGPERSRCEVLVQKLSVRCEFRGWQEGASRDRWFEDAALLLFPSVWPEPFGLVGLEAAARGVPAVAFKVGGIGEWLEEGVSGRFAEGNQLNGASLGTAVAEALRSEPAWRRLSEGAVATAARLSLKAHLDRLESVLESILRTARER